MGTIKFITAIILCVGFVNQDSFFGTYSCSGRFSMESLQLNKDATFVYIHKTEFTTQQLEGTFSIVGDSIVLNSFPKREKIIVKEAGVKSRGTIFNVSDKTSYGMMFHLTITANSGKKITYRDCFNKIKIRRKKIKSFHIMNSMGLNSPEYFVQGTQTNSFAIQLETLRGFDNEKWYIDKTNKMIRPIGFSGEPENYSLKKNE